MVHGFDIALDEPEVFARALARAEAMAEAADVPVRVVRTDMRSRIPVRFAAIRPLGVPHGSSAVRDRIADVPAVVNNHRVCWIGPQLWPLREVRPDHAELPCNWPLSSEKLSS
jgi:hypothetical protein